MAANVELGMQGPGALRRPLNKALMVQLRPGTARTARRRARPAARSRRSSASSSRTRQCSAASTSRPACSWGARSTPASVRCVACLALLPVPYANRCVLPLCPLWECARVSCWETQEKRLRAAARNRTRLPR